jgi:hypothetical protein
MHIFLSGDKFLRDFLFTSVFRVVERAHAKRKRRVSRDSSIFFIFYEQRNVEFLLRDTVGSSEDPPLVDEGAAAHRPFFVTGLVISEDGHLIGELLSFCLFPTCDFFSFNHRLRTQSHGFLGRRAGCFGFVHLNSHTMLLFGYAYPQLGYNFM